MRAASTFLILPILVVLGGTAHATANYVYHEQTTATTGGTCGAYLATLTPTSADSYPLEAKVEYQFFTDMVAVYYTTDGSLPAGAFGVPSGTTTALTGSYLCTFTDPGGVVDVAGATIPSEPAGTIVTYAISAWHSGGGPEVFANSGTCSGCGACTTSSCATTFTYTVAAPPVADLAASIIDSPDPTFAGDTLHLAVTATNAGPDDASAVTLTTNLAATVSVGALPAGCVMAGATAVTCSFAAIAAGASATKTIDVTPLAGAPPSITTTVSVSSTGPAGDPNGANDMAAELTTVGDGANVGVTLSAPGSVSPGAAIAYVMTVANAGPSPSAAPITASVTLPVAVTITATPPTCMMFGNLVTCAVGTLAAGASIMLEVDGLAPMSGALDANASITMTTHDGDASNDTAIAHTDVVMTLIDAAPPPADGAVATIDAAAPPGIDAMVGQPDAGATHPDAAANPDAGGAQQGSVGCGCDAGGRGSRGMTAILCLTALAVTLTRRRARRRR